MFRSRMAGTLAGVSILVGLTTCSWLSKDDGPGEEDLASATPIPPKPIPADPDAATRAEDDTIRRVWLERNMADAYERVGLKDPTWDEPARVFIREGMAFLLGSVDREQMRRQGEKLVALGCADPLVLYFHALNRFWLEHQSREVTQLFERAVSGMRSVPYPRAVARYAASGLYRDYARSDEAVGRRGGLAPLELQWFLQSLFEEGSYTPGDDSVLASQLMSGTGESLFERNKEPIAAAVVNTPWAEEWMKRLLSGMKEIELAWDARGHGWARDVTEEGWKGFREHMRLARKDLMEAWRLRPDRPEAPLVMMSIALAGEAGPGESVRTWFDRTVAAQLDNEDAYGRMLNQLRPRWGGSYDAMLAFGRECLQTQRFDTEVPRILFKAVEDIEDDQIQEGRERTIYDEPGTYELLSQVFEGYLVEPSQAADRWRFQSLYAISAYKTGQYADAWKHLQAVDSRLHRAAAACVDEPSEWVVTRAAALAGTGGDKALEAERFFQQGNGRAARRLFQQAAKQAQATQARRYFEQSLSIVSFEEDLARGEWVSFLPTASFIGWDRQLGEWRVEDDGSVRGTTGSKGKMLVSTARVGPDFEVRGQIELGSSTNDMFQAGVVFGYPEFERSDWLSFRVIRGPAGGLAACLASHFSRPDVMERFEGSERFSFLLRSWDGKVTVHIDGVPVIEDHQPTEGFVSNPDARVGFGGYVHDNTFDVAYRDVEIRKLKPAPKPSR